MQIRGKRGIYAIGANRVRLFLVMPVFSLHAIQQPSDPKMVTKQPPNDTKAIPKCSPRDPKLIPKWWTSGHQVIPK